MLYSAAVAVCRPLQVGSKRENLHGREPGKRGIELKLKSEILDDGEPGSTSYGTLSPALKSLFAKSRKPSELNWTK